MRPIHAPKTRAGAALPAPPPGAEEGRRHGGAAAAGGVPLAQAHLRPAGQRRSRRDPARRERPSEGVAADGEGKVARGKAAGKLLAEKAKAAGITKVVFDRAGYRYHGRVQAVADGAREGGLEF